MTSYVSTRGNAKVSFPEALLSGLAPDGGLFLPEELGRLPDTPPATDSATDVAAWAAPTLLPDVPPDVLRAIVVDALDFPMPLVEVEPDVYVLELFHGPTHAFKDVGARFLARLGAWAAGVADGSPGSDRTVLVATSGDTGGAVAAAFHGVPGFRVVALFPRGGVSERQRRQMTTLGGNVLAVGVRGTFDDCQGMVKAAFSDPELRAQHRLTSANSINVGRLLPQALYYIVAAVRLGWDGNPARFVVPSGNLGNLCAGLVAAATGMPTRGFLAATNENRVFVDVLEGARFEPRSSIATDSNAMDVGAPSNLERILWLYAGSLTDLRGDVSAVAVDGASARATQEDVFHRLGYLMDPHTAVAYDALRRRGEPGPNVVLATAHPAKFPRVTEEVAGAELPLPPGLAEPMKREEQMAEAEPTVGALRDLLAGVHE